MASMLRDPFNVLTLLLRSNPAFSPQPQSIAARGVSWVSRVMVRVSVTLGLVLVSLARI